MSEVKIIINSDHEIHSMHVIDSKNQKVEIKNGQTFDINYGWFELKIPYLGVKNEFHKISLNDVDLNWLLYTGYFENSNGQKFQPACAVWEEGFFRIWLHTEVGYWRSSIINQIRNGDFGTNLFEKYMLTCDSPVFGLDRNIYGNDVVNFFEYNFGPTWWFKNDINRPYTVLNNDTFSDIDKKKLEKEALELAKFHDVNDDGWETHDLKEKSDLPLIDVNEFSGEIKKVIDLIGYKSIIDVSLGYVRPKSHIRIHIDDHINRKSWPYIAGCKKFYWVLGNTENVYFKFHQAGLLPTESPLLINAGMHTHSVVNDSDITRPALLIYGDLDFDQVYKYFKNLQVDHLDEYEYY